MSSDLDMCNQISEIIFAKNDYGLGWTQWSRVNQKSVNAELALSIDFVP